MAYRPGRKYIILSDYLCYIGQFFALTAAQSCTVRRQKGLDYACLLTSLRHCGQQTSFLLHRFNLTIAAHTSRLNHAIGEIHSVGHRLQIGLRRFRESSVVALFVLGPWIDPFYDTSIRRCETPSHRS